jgi:hypothetical protein
MAGTADRHGSRLILTVTPTVVLVVRKVLTQAQPPRERVVQEPPGILFIRAAMDTKALTVQPR